MRDRVGSRGFLSLQGFKDGQVHETAKTKISLVEGKKKKKEKFDSSKFNARESKKLSLIK